MRNLSWIVFNMERGIHVEKAMKVSFSKPSKFLFKTWKRGYYTVQICESLLYNMCILFEEAANYWTFLRARSITLSKKAQSYPTSNLI